MEYLLILLCFIVAVIGGYYPVKGIRNGEKEKAGRRPELRLCDQHREI